MRVFKPSFDLGQALRLTRERGYYFAADAVEEEVRQGMQAEINKLPLELEDKATYPIRKGTETEVKQLHSRAYRELAHPDVPYGSKICQALAEVVQGTGMFVDELASWLLTEIGYQRYRQDSDWIAPHRDRRSDKFLSITFTISGSAWMRIYKSKVNPPDYRQLEIIDSFLTQPGTVMFLRAPGFGSGEQEIHEVMPPKNGVRDILNLRMQPTLLRHPWKELVLK